MTELALNACFVRRIKHQTNSSCLSKTETRRGISRANVMSCVSTFNCRVIKVHNTLGLNVGAAVAGHLRIGVGCAGLPQGPGSPRHQQGSGIVSDYYVHIKRMGNLRSEWEWRILQRSKEIGVGLYGRGFATAEAARRNGESTLEKFLADLALVRASTGNRPATSTNDCPNLSGT